MSQSNDIWVCQICGHENTGCFCCECGWVKPGYVKNSTAAHSSGGDPSVTSNDSDNKAPVILPPNFVQPSFPYPYPYPDQMPARGMMCEPPFRSDDNSSSGYTCDNDPWVCPRCGCEVKGGLYCFTCGARNPRAVSNTAQSEGEQETWVCNNCGAQVNGSAFCHECGSKKV